MAKQNKQGKKNRETKNCFLMIAGEIYLDFSHGIKVLVRSFIQIVLNLFCLSLTDVINFYLSGTQRVISFLRQMMEHGGFYRTSDQAWVQFERIQFVGACNPPTDPGRKPLTHRYRTLLVQPKALWKSCFTKLHLICFFGKFASKDVKSFQFVKVKAPYSWK